MPKLNIIYIIYQSVCQYFLNNFAVKKIATNYEYKIMAALAVLFFVRLLA